MALLPCTHCRRHVSVDETRCPFCAGALSLQMPELRVVQGRFRRRALMTLGASAIVAGCSSNDAGNNAPPYGIAPDTGLADTAASDASTDTGSDTGSSADTSSDSTTDAGADTRPADAATDTRDGGVDTGIDTGGALPPYGIPPTDAG